MNMFQKANDIKSNLILNVLSWVDFLKPKYCIFENVRGFLSFNLNATQAGKHRVEGGIEMGGLKFVVRALVEMRQVAKLVAPPTTVLSILPATKSDLVFSKRHTMELLNPEYVSSSSQPNTGALSPSSHSPLITSRWPIH
jgi:hypothetical protein